MFHKEFLTYFCIKTRIYDHFCKKPRFYVSNFEIQVLVHQRHIKWKDRKMDPIGSAHVPPPSLCVIKVFEIRKKEDIPFVFETQIRFIDTNKMERLSSGPIGFSSLFPLWDKKSFLPGNKCETFRLGVHLTSLSLR